MGLLIVFGYFDGFSGQITGPGCKPLALTDIIVRNRYIASAAFIRSLVTQ